MIMIPYGQSYYRLKLVDVDGKFKYSYVVVVTIKPQYSGEDIPQPGNVCSQYAGILR
jgi:hypothetical protein